MPPAGVESRESGFRKQKLSTPCRNRTCDTRFRKPVLYPTELRGHKGLQ
jgi:hypothetical protein